MTSEADSVLEQLNVSRETSERLIMLANLLTKWNPRINLVSKSSLKELWTRHIFDSAQVFQLAAHPVAHWVDIGSGGGFPGLVVALMAPEHGTPKVVTLIESDQRKCAFLRTVLRETGVEGTVLAERIEKTKGQDADILSARALADLSTLFTFADHHLAPNGTALFSKGASWEKEVEMARESWSFNLDVITSKTDPNSVVLKVKDIQRV